MSFCYFWGLPFLLQGVVDNIYNLKNSFQFKNCNVFSSQYVRTLERYNLTCIKSFPTECIMWRERAQHRCVCWRNGRGKFLDWRQRLFVTNDMGQFFFFFGLWWLIKENWHAKKLIFRIRMFFCCPGKIPCLPDPTVKLFRDCFSLLCQILWSLRQCWGVQMSGENPVQQCWRNLNFGGFFP